MKHISQITSKIFASKSAFPKTQDQKTLEKQKSDMDSFMLSFSSHESIVDSVQKTLFEIYKARNLSGLLIREMRVEDFYQLKDGWRGTFEQRISHLEEEMANVLDGTERDRVCNRVVELLNAALVAVSHGGNFDGEVYDSWKSDSLSVELPRRGSSISALTTPSRILSGIDSEYDEARIFSTKQLD